LAAWSAAYTFPARDRKHATEAPRLPAYILEVLHSNDSIPTAA
jgi:hypothetical protein